MIHARRLLNIEPENIQLSLALRGVNGTWQAVKKDRRSKPAGSNLMMKSKAARRSIG